MEPGGGPNVMKPINIDPKDIGLHDTDSSELRCLLFGISSIGYLLISSYSLVPVAPSS